MFGLALRSPARNWWVADLQFQRQAGIYKYW